MTSKMKALSIRQPWAWLILHGGKDIENRSWPTRFRGRFLIHAAKGCTRNEYAEAVDFVWTFWGGKKGREIPMLNQLERGGIIGEAELVDCVEESSSRWFMGNYNVLENQRRNLKLHGFVLRNVKPLPFRPCKGALGFFEPKFEEATR